MTDISRSPGSELATLGGGCFWCLEAVFDQVKGVESVESGYMGGGRPNPTYEAVCTGTTGHAEIIQVQFNPNVISFRELLEIFFGIHDPTTLNRQGNDRGTSYRSAIFYTTDEQKEVAIKTIEDVNESGIWPGEVVTTVEPAGDFWQAEPEHQNYLLRNPNGYTCHFPREDWVLPKDDKAVNN